MHHEQLCVIGELAAERVKAKRAPQADAICGVTHTFQLTYYYVLPVLVNILKDEYKASRGSVGNSLGSCF